MMIPSIVADRNADVANASAVRELPAVVTSCDDCHARQLSVCASVEGAAWVAFTALGRRLVFGTRSLLFREGDPADAVYSVTAGVIRTFRLLPDGRCQIVGFALPGDFIGATSGTRHSFSADTAGRASVCRFSQRSFWGFVEQHPSLLRSLHNAAVRGIDLAHDQMIIMGIGGARQKLALFLLTLLRRRKISPGANAFLPLPMTRQDIGDFIGLSIWTVSRLLNEFARRGVIRIVPGGVDVLHRAVLDRMAGETTSS